MAFEIASLSISSNRILALGDGFDANMILTGRDTLTADHPGSVCCMFNVQRTDLFDTDLISQQINSLKNTHAEHQKVFPAGSM